MKNELRQQTFNYITAAFGFVAGLAWNEAIKALIETFFSTQKDSLVAKFTYAILMTAFVVIINRLVRK